jgi:nucleoside-diphosphate-sugar epimerase
MRCLVTGGAGAIGSNLVARLISDGHKVTVIDDLSSGHRSLVPEEAELVVGSVAIADDVDKAFDCKPEVVFHLAALFANQNSVDHPQVDLTVNGSGTLRVLEAAAHGNTRKVLNVSSSCVYGDDPVMRETETDLRPHTPYAITKLLGEHYCTFFAEHHGLDVVSVRPFNVYGPNEYPGRYRNVVPNFFGLALAGKPLLITGTGDETRDFTFMSDVVEGMIKAVEAATEPGSVFNLGSGRETRIRDIAETINELTGNTAGVEFAPRRSWDKVVRRRSDISLAKQTFGYDPVTTVSEGLRHTHSWLDTAVA